MNSRSRLLRRPAHTTLFVRSGGYACRPRRRQPPAESPGNLRGPQSGGVRFARCSKNTLLGELSGKPSETAYPEAPRAAETGSEPVRFPLHVGNSHLKAESRSGGAGRGYRCDDLRQIPVFGSACGARCSAAARSMQSGSLLRSSCPRFPGHGDRGQRGEGGGRAHGDRLLPPTAAHCRFSRGRPERQVRTYRQLTKSLQKQMHVTGWLRIGKVIPFTPRIRAG